MWDALRLHKANGGGTLVTNAISIEGAVWEEAFFNEAPIAYTATTDPGHVITYTTDQLRRHSWAFWFQQSAHMATNAAGTFINSRTGADDALIIMKEWSAASITSQYDRDNTAAYRTPNASSLPEFVALMKIEHRRPKEIGEFPSSYKDTLTDPIGLTYVPGSVDCEAVSLGWRNTQHSDMKNNALYDICSWFNDVFRIKARIIK